jgi:hypothetical protein
MKKEINLNNINEISNFYFKIITSNLLNKNEHFFDLSLKSLSSIFNKIENTKSLSELIENKFDYLIHELNVNSDKEKIIKIMSWLSKGLIIRGFYKYSDQIISLFCDLLFIPDFYNFSKFISLGFDIIMSDDTFVLSKDSSIRFQVLFKQRIFSFVLNKLFKNIEIEKINSNNNNNIEIEKINLNNNNIEIEKINSNNNIEIEKNNNNNESSILIIISTMIKNISTIVLLNEFDRVFPFVLKSLKSENKFVLISSLSTLLILLKNANTQMVDHLHSIMNILLRLSSFNDSMDVRFISIECILEIQNYSFKDIFRFKELVVLGLEKSLDDKKRKIRNLSVKCRNNWIVMEQ